MAARASGPAQRRKLRRPRAALRHEQQSIAMALASALSHSADKTTRAQHNAPRGQKNSGTEHYGPQDQQRTEEHTADYAPVVQIWDTLVPQREDQLVAVLSHVDSLVPEQVVAVPKISWPSRFPRTVLREPQKAEQLVEALTIVSLLRVFEQTVDIPVGAGGSGCGGHKGFLPGQSSSPTVEQIVDILDLEVFNFYTQERAQQRLPSRTLTFLLVVVFKVPIQIRGPQRFFQIFMETHLKKVFRTFPRREKSAKVTRQVGAGVVADFQLIHAGGSARPLLGR